MPPRKKKTPNVYDTPFTPLFEEVPTGMSVVDRAVYGFVVRMETREAKKSTASAATIGLAIGANEKTVDRTLARLMEWNVIKRIYKGKTKKEPSHYVSVPRSKWDENTINGAAQNKTEKRKLARVNLSGTRVNLSEDKGQFVQDKGQIDPQRESKRVSKERSKRDVPTRKSKEEKKRSSSPAQTSLSPDANNHIKGGYPQYLPEQEDRPYLEQFISLYGTRAEAREATAAAILEWSKLHG